MNTVQLNRADHGKALGSQPRGTLRHGRLTARKVAQAIGYAPGTLYNLFRNRDEMILHLNGRTLDRLCRDRTVSEMAGSLVHHYLAGLRAERGED